MTTKEQLYKLCKLFTSKRLEIIKHKLSEIQDALGSETKSTAGDKHETGRAMLQLEREKTGQQLAEIQKINDTLLKIDPRIQSATIKLGSIVYTSKLNYFIAVSAGELEVGEDRFFAISPSTPIGQLLLLKSINDTITFRDQNFTIKAII